MGICCSTTEPIIPYDTPNIDPLVQQIRDLQDKARQTIFIHSEVSALYRYLFNTEAKAKNVIIKLSERKVALENDEKALIYQIAKYDAQQLRNATKGLGCDETAVAKILVLRLPDQIALTDSIYAQEYDGVNLETLINKEGKSNLGWLLTGGLSDFGKFMSYRVTPQPRRDALILMKAMKGMGCDDKLLIEILNTRTNAEMRAAVHAYGEAFNEDLVKRIQSETGGMFAKNYGAWMDRLVLFDRNEDKACPYDASQIDSFADQLYAAGAAKTFGCDESKFLDILNQANDATIQLIKISYGRYGDLQKHVEKKMGGDLEHAVVARITPRFDFLASRIYKACKGFGTDEECIARILGCLTNLEVMILVERYNELYKGFDAPYNNFRVLMQNELSGDFLESIIIMLDGTPPKGHWRSNEMYPIAAKTACNFFHEVVISDYNEKLAIAEGKTPLTGPLQFIGINPQLMFDTRDIDDNYTPAYPYVEPTIEQALFRPIDSLAGGGEEEEKKTIIMLLKEAIIQQEAEIEKYKNLLPSLKIQYDNISKDYKYLDALVKQYQDDVFNLRSFCTKFNIPIVE